MEEGWVCDRKGWDDVEGMLGGMGNGKFVYEEEM